MSHADFPKLAYSICELANDGPIGRSSIYNQIAAGRLRARKIGRRTKIAPGVDTRGDNSQRPGARSAGASSQARRKASEIILPSGRHAEPACRRRIAASAPSSFALIFLEGLTPLARG